MTTIRLVPNSSIASVRTMFSAKQKYRCPICKGTIASGMVALDHCHATGHIRATLCGSCNRNEGKVKAAAKYMTKTDHMARTDYILWLERLAMYLRHHEANPSGMIHPTFDYAKGKQKPRKRPKKRSK